MNKPAEKLGQFQRGFVLSKIQLDRITASIIKRIVGGLNVQVRTINNQIVISKKKEG